MSSKRIEYPTWRPSWTVKLALASSHTNMKENRVPSISSATRLATDIAATRRGCVHATSLPLVWGKSENATNCGILEFYEHHNNEKPFKDALGRLSRTGLANHNDDLVVRKLCEFGH
jgi:hypothetical protein